MEKVKKVFLWFFVFLFFIVLLNYICFENTSFDFLWSYGFSHAIKIGEIPYTHFNTISTPLYFFIMSFFLFIQDSYLTYIIVQSFFCTMFVFLLYRYIGKKSWIILAILSFPFFVSFIGTYNFFVLFLLVLLFYLEEKKKSDFLIGLILGFLLLSKQTIGGVVLVFNLFLLFDIKRILRRISGIFIPVLLFFMYLLITNSFASFIDLCFLGLFDFNSSNGHFQILSILSIIMLFSIIISYFKNKNIYCSYVIGAFFFSFPLFDLTHFIMFLGIYILYFIRSDSKQYDYLSKAGCVLFFLILGFNVFLKLDFYSNLSYLDFNHFEHYLVQKKDKKIFHEVYEKYNSYSNSIMIGSESMLFDIASNRKITYFDMPLTGNYGKNGTDGMIKKLDTLHHKVIFINRCHYEYLTSETQLDYYLIKHVVEHGNKIDEVLCYDVYSWK